MDIVTFEDFKEYHPLILGGAGQSLTEAYNLCKYLKATDNIDGDVIEVGVHNGGSAQILKKYKNSKKKLFLFDTFEGLMDCGSKDTLKNGMMSFDYSYVQDFFKYETDVIITKGYFPESAVNILPRKISFVHLDVDTYTSTLSSLNYIFDFMVDGGTIVIHDYINNPETPGVTAAVDEFLINKKEKIITESSGDVSRRLTQGIIIKCESSL